MTVSVYKKENKDMLKQYPLVPNSEKSDYDIGGTVSVYYTDTEVVFSFECPYDHPLKLPYSAYNDPVWRGEAVEIFIAPYADCTHYFEFDTAPNNSCYNAQVLNVGDPTVYVRSIDNCPVVYNSNICNEYYTTEIRIPFAFLLKSGESPLNIPWLFNAYRISHGKDVKMFALSPTNQASFHVPSKFSFLKFN